MVYEFLVLWHQRRPSLAELLGPHVQGLQVDPSLLSCLSAATVFVNLKPMLINPNRYLRSWVPSMISSSFGVSYVDRP